LTRRIAAALEREGFRVRRPGILAIDTAPGFCGWLGLNVVARRGLGDTEVNILVGVRCEEVESIVGELSNQASARYFVATIRTHIGYLTAVSAYQPWYAAPDAPADCISEIVSTISEIGLPFMRKNSGLVQIVRRFRDGQYADADHQMYRLPVCLYLLGDVPQARALCLEYVASLEDRDDMAATMLRDFLQAFLSSLATS
jgi:hypothetical protein